MLENQSTQGLDLVVSHTNAPDYFLPVSQWYCGCVFFVGSPLLPLDEGLDQVIAEAPHHKVYLVVHTDFQELLFHGTLVQTVYLWKPPLKKKNKICRGIFKIKIIIIGKRRNHTYPCTNKNTYLSHSTRIYPPLLSVSASSI